MWRSAADAEAPVNAGASARWLQRRLEAAAADLLQLAEGVEDEFTTPLGEPSLTAPDSVSWRVFKNPVALLIGGIAAVILELAEPRVRTGVWEHTSFRERPLERLRRTGHATMMTVYGARSRAEAMIERVARMHQRVAGVTADGMAYSATDPELLGWVQATACFGFVEAYHVYVHPLSSVERDGFFVEARLSAQRYGVIAAPDSQAALDALFDTMRSKLEASDIVPEFLHIMRRMPALPWPLRPLQSLFVRAAVQITPAWVRERLGLDAHWQLRSWQRSLVRHAAQAADRLILPTSPPVQACRRLGLPDDYLFRPARPTAASCR